MTGHTQLSDVERGRGSRGGRARPAGGCGAATGAADQCCGGGAGVTGW